MYLAQICCAALESSPALLLGGARQIDGLTLLKTRQSYGFFDHVEPVVRGTWHTRISAYKKLFGSCPFEGNAGDLERLRKLRNDAGHCFGRDIHRLKGAESALVERLDRISDERIQKFLAVAERVAVSVELQLASTYVGAYELLRLYHVKRTDLQKIVGRRERADAFNRLVNDTIGSPCGKAYADAVIAEYEQA